jgi:transposase
MVMAARVKGRKAWRKGGAIRALLAREADALALHAAGKGDREIAEFLGVSLGVVFQWRKKSGLPPAHKAGRPRLAAGAVVSATAERLARIEAAVERLVALLTPPAAGAGDGEGI